MNKWHERRTQMQASGASSSTRHASISCKVLATKARTKTNQNNWDTWQKHSADAQAPHLLLGALQVECVLVSAQVEAGDRVAVRLGQVPRCATLAGAQVQDAHSLRGVSILQQYTSHIQNMTQSACSQHTQNIKEHALCMRSRAE